MELKAKKIHLMECAEKLFAEKGYAETSIRDIAKQAAMNSAMISYYFGSKENMVIAILDYRTLDLGKEFTLDTNYPGKPVNQLLDFVNFYIDRVFEQKHFYKLVFQLQSSDKENDFIKHLNIMRRKNYESLTSMFKSSLDNGDLVKDPDFAMITSTLVGTLTHIVFNPSYYRDVYNLKRMPEKKFMEFLKERTKEHLNLVVSCLLK